MINNTYKIADTVFSLSTEYESVHQLCTDYVSEEIPEFDIIVSAEDISYESERSRLNDKKNGTAIRSFSEDYLETLAVYRKLCDKLVD